MRRISHSWKDVYFLCLDLSVTNMLKVSCISSLKWQLSNCLSKPEASGAQTLLKPWDLGEAGKKGTRRGTQRRGLGLRKLSRTPWTVKADACVSRQRGHSTKASVRLEKYQTLPITYCQTLLPSNDGLSLSPSFFHLQLSLPYYISLSHHIAFSHPLTPHPISLSSSLSFSFISLLSLIFPTPWHSTPSLPHHHLRGHWSGWVSPTGFKESSTTFLSLGLTRVLWASVFFIWKWKLYLLKVFTLLGGIKQIIFINLETSCLTCRYLTDEKNSFPNEAQESVNPALDTQPAFNTALHNSHEGPANNVLILWVWKLRLKEVRHLG